MVSTAERTLHRELNQFRGRREWFSLTEKFILEYMPDFFASNGFEVFA